MAKAKEEFVVIHGTVKTPQGVVKHGEEISLDPDEAKKMDPHGHSLMPKALWDAEQQAKKAADKARAESLAESAKKAADKAKGGGK